ncbi:zinc-ribbon domain-containing protein [Candidatus Omnitrophota bacterium]
MKKCTNCHRNNKKEAKFCGHCGLKLKERYILRIYSCVVVTNGKRERFTVKLKPGETEEDIRIFYEKRGGMVVGIRKMREKNVVT